MDYAARNDDLGTISRATNKKIVNVSPEMREIKILSSFMNRNAYACVPVVRSFTSTRAQKSAQTYTQIKYRSNICAVYPLTHS